MTVKIMRGVPGSGKSFRAKEILKDWLEGEGSERHKGVILSADQYFIKYEGQYKFKPSEIGEAHQDCFRRFSARLGGINKADTLIIIDNTNTRLWECAPYVLAAETEGHDVELISIRPKFRDDLMAMWERNTHGVDWPLQVAMNERFELAPPHWNETTIEVSFAKDEAGQG